MKKNFVLIIFMMLLLVSCNDKKCDCGCSDSNDTLQQESDRYLEWITGDFLLEEPNQEVGSFEFDGYQFEYYGIYQKNQCIYLSSGGYIKSINANDLLRIQINHNGYIHCYACDINANIIEPRDEVLTYVRTSIIGFEIENLDNFILINEGEVDCNIGYLLIEK